MTPSELKRKVIEAGHSPYYFSKDTMKFFGDTMRNYGVRSSVWNGKQVWELYRKSPVKHGNIGSAYFCKETYKRVHEANQI